MAVTFIFFTLATGSHYEDPNATKDTLNRDDPHLFVYTYLKCCFVVQVTGTEGSKS